MGRRKSTVNFVAVSDITKPATDQEGILVTVEGRGGDTATNREKALELVNRMWEDGEIAAEHFPDGVTQDNLFYVPDDNPEPLNPAALSPIVQGAQEIIQLTKLQLEAQDAADEAAPYIPIIEAVLARTRPLTPEERELAKERKYGKVIERMGAVIASQEDYQAQCTGHGQLILNAIAWQHQQKSAIALPEEE
jgi:hypothetical protein